MPQFISVLCHKCSVLQIKPANKMGTKWCCSMCREPECKVHAAPDSKVTDVSQFVEELNLPQEEEEMESVSATFHGVENLNGALNWEVLNSQTAKKQPQNNWRHFKPVETYGGDYSKRSRFDDKETEPKWEKHLDLRSGDIVPKRAEPQHKQFLSYLWRRWHQTAFKKNPVELVEFAGDVGNEENTPPSR